MDPVLCADGHSYERAAVAAWLAAHNNSPLTGEQLPNRDLVPNRTLKSLIADFAERQRYRNEQISGRCFLRQLNEMRDTAAVRMSIRRNALERHVLKLKF